MAKITNKIVTKITINSVKMDKTSVDLFLTGTNSEIGFSCFGMDSFVFNSELWVVSTVFSSSFSKS